MTAARPIVAVIPFGARGSTPRAGAWARQLAARLVERFARDEAVDLPRDVGVAVGPEGEHPAGPQNPQGLGDEARPFEPVRGLRHDQEVRAAPLRRDGLGCLAPVFDARLRRCLGKLGRRWLAGDHAPEAGGERDGRLAAARRDVDGEFAGGSNCRKPVEEFRRILGAVAPVSLRLPREVILERRR